MGIPSQTGNSRSSWRPVEPVLHKAKSSGARIMISLRQAWAGLQTRLKILEPVPFSAEHWTVIDRLNANFNDREAHTRLPMPIAYFRKAAIETIYGYARQFDDVRTEYVNDSWFVEKFSEGDPDTM